jgi:class 3 adenylate cyclase
MVARLEDLAGDNQILLSPATFHRVKENVAVKAWKPRYLTGFDEPVVIYELMNVLDAQSNQDHPTSGQIAVNE